MIAITDISMTIIALNILFLIRVCVVFRADMRALALIHIKRIEDIHVNRANFRYDYSMTAGATKRELDLTKWTFKQLYPELKE